MTITLNFTVKAHYRPFKNASKLPGHVCGCGFLLVIPVLYLHKEGSVICNYNYRLCQLK